VVLFFTLIALVAMSLAAVALIRSVDTSAMIIGNLAYKQTTTASAEFGISHAIARLRQISLDNLAFDLDQNAAHAFNQTNLAANPGYYSSLDPTWDMTDGNRWDDANEFVDAGTDASGSHITYIIQRMCRTPGVNKLAADCLLASSGGGADEKGTKGLPDNCVTESGGLCESSGQPAQIRITVRSEGPQRSISFVQGFIY
jgi:hypothetical protein